MVGAEGGAGVMVPIFFCASEKIRKIHSAHPPIDFGTILLGIATRGGLLLCTQ